MYLFINKMKDSLKFHLHVVMLESTALVMLCTERKGIDSINQNNAVIFFKTTSIMFVDPFSTKGVLPKEILYFAHLWLLHGDSA